MIQCVIFLVVFNPIIQYIKEHSDKTGYDIKTYNNNSNNQFTNTTPFADDFKLISRNKTQHQKLIADIHCCCCCHYCWLKSGQ